MTQGNSTCINCGDEVYLSQGGEWLHRPCGESFCFAKTKATPQPKDLVVTITISRATAEGWITEAHDTTDRKAVLVALACRAALEGER